MKTHKFILRTALLGLAFALIASFSNHSEDYSIDNTTFKRGEKFTYKLHYGLITGGYPVLKVYDKHYISNSKPCHKIEVYGKSAGMVDKLFRVKDTWRSVVDTNTMLPQYAYRNIKEGDYKLKEYTYLNRGKGKVQVDRYRSKKETKYYDAPEGIHDIVSGFYYFRNVDWANKSVGSSSTIKAFFENELYTLKVVYKGKSTIKTKLGKIEAYKLAPEVPNNDLFDGEDSIEFWLSADKNKVPLKIKADMFVGAIELDIIKYENLKHPIKFK